MKAGPGIAGDRKESATRSILQATRAGSEPAARQRSRGGLSKQTDAESGSGAGLRTDKERDPLRWELQTIRAHLHRVSEVLQTALNRLELIRITLERCSKRLGIDEEEEQGPPTT